MLRTPDVSYITLPGNASTTFGDILKMKRVPKNVEPRAHQEPDNSQRSGKSPPQKPRKPRNNSSVVRVTIREKERVADDESMRPMVTAEQPAIERVAAVHLDLRSRFWPQHRKAEAAGVSLSDWRALLADPLIIPTLEEAWRQILLGLVGPALRGLGESAILVGREGATDRAMVFRMVGLIKQPGRGAETPAPSALHPSGVGNRLDAARAGRTALPAPGMDSSLPEAIDADYVEEPDQAESGDTSEFV
jgi:hypothetical protein